MLSGDRYTYICGQWFSEAITDCVHGFGIFYSAALIPDFSRTVWSHPSHWLLDIVPDKQSDLSCPWNSWCCVMYSAVDSFFCPMNFNNFFFPSLQKHWVFHSVSLHCWILFFLLPFRSPITICPVEKQSCETQSTIQPAEGMSISSKRIGGQFFFFLRGKIRVMLNLRSNELKMCWRQLMLSDNGWGRSEWENVLNSLHDSCFKIYVSLF